MMHRQMWVCACTVSGAVRFGFLSFFLFFDFTGYKIYGVGGV